MRAALLLAVLLLAGCGVDPAAERRELVLGITEAANASDEDAVRSQVERLLQLLDRQVADDELSAEDADRLRDLAVKVAAGADLLDEELQAKVREAEQARREAEEAQRLLEEERRKAEETGKPRKGEGNKDDEEKDDD